MRTVHSRTDIPHTLRMLVGACALAVILPACTKQSSVEPSPEVTAAAATQAAEASDLNWARDALRRNPAIEVVATDTSAGVFTIRSKDTGEVRAVKASELAAVPISMLSAPARTAAAPAETPSATTAVPPAATAVPQPATSAPAETTAGTSVPSTAMGSPQPQSSSPNYTIERADGQVKVSGPGVSIVSTGTTTVTPSEGTAGQRSVEPIICEGRRMLHFDNRNIYVDGDAIIARGGCELFITNSRVSASGTGLVVSDATVHIANSTVEGSAASFDARDGAKVYVRSSTFQGLPRRAENAVVQDQGGNQWR